MNKEPDSWITINGQHVPIFEGEGKREAVSRFLKGKSRVARNKDKYDTIANYKKRKATNQLDKKDEFDWRGDKKDFKKLIKQGDNRYIVVRNDETEDEAIRKFNQRENPYNMASLKNEQHEEQIDRYVDAQNKRRNKLVKFTQENRDEINDWISKSDDETYNRIYEKTKRGEGLTLKEYYQYLGREPREGDVIIAGGKNGEDVRVGKNGKLEIINKFKKRKSSNKWLTK